MTHWRKNQIKGPSASPPPPPPTSYPFCCTYIIHNLGALEICLPLAEMCEMCVINWPLVLHTPSQHGDSSHLSSFAGVL